jgi:hypothetical protein
MGKSISTLEQTREFSPNLFLLKRIYRDKLKNIIMTALAAKSAVEEHVVCVADAVIVVLGRGLATVAATVAALAGVTLAVARDGQLGIGIVVEVDHEVEEAHTLLLPPALLLRLGLGPD